MATKTSRYQLVKPDQDDFYNVDDFNDNADKIDTALGAHEDKSIVSEEGAHDIRFYNNKLSVRQDGVWRDAQIFATVRVAVPSGAVVKATHDNHTRVATAVDGYAYIEVNYRGKWQFVATYQTGVSETVVKDIQSNDDVDITLNFATVFVTGKQTSTLTLTHTDGTVITRSYTTDGQTETVYLPKLGTWSARLYWSDFHFDKTVSATNYINYNCSLNYRVFGVRINEADSNPQTNHSYTYESTMYNEGSWSLWRKSEIFRNWQPIGYNASGKITPLSWDNYAVQQSGKKGYDPDYAVDITSKDEVYILIPKTGLRITKSGNYVDILMTNYQQGEDQGFNYYAFSKDSEGDCSAIAVGAYLSGNLSDGNANYRSLSGQNQYLSQTTVTNYDTLIDNARSRGDKFSNITWWTHILFIASTTIINKRAFWGHSPCCIFRTSTPQSYITTTGFNNQIGFGIAMPWTSTNGYTKFMGCENYMGDMGHPLDCVQIRTSRSKINGIKYRRWRNDAWHEIDTTSASALGWISNVAGTNELGFLPTATNGSQTTYYKCKVSDVAWDRISDTNVYTIPSTTTNILSNTDGSADYSRNLLHLGVYTDDTYIGSKRRTRPRMQIYLSTNDWNGW